MTAITEIHGLPGTVVRVKNYRKPGGPYEIGTITRVETSWDVAMNHRTSYTVRLHRRSDAGNLIHLTVGELYIDV